MYSSITVTTKHGEFTTSKCDYYIQDNILTVFRKERIDDRWREKIYFPLEAHYPMENVIAITCVKRD